MGNLSWVYTRLLFPVSDCVLMLFVVSSPLPKLHPLWWQRSLHLLCCSFCVELCLVLCAVHCELVIRVGVVTFSALACLIFLSCSANEVVLLFTSQKDAVKASALLVCSLAHCTRRSSVDPDIWFCCCTPLNSKARRLRRLVSDFARRTKTSTRSRISGFVSWFLCFSALPLPCLMVLQGDERTCRVAGAKTRQMWFMSRFEELCLPLYTLVCVAP